MKSSESDDAIDAVITWVDGSDKEHFKKRQKVLGREQNKNEHDLVTGNDETRFIDNGELKYCILSIRRFAPWIQTIHLVTDNQRPEYLTPEFQKKYRINLVDHTDIFRAYESVLPTFNTRTIETALWRIPGLAPRFIYFNDDFILVNEVAPQDFFNGKKVVLRGTWKPMSNYGKARIVMNKLVSYVAKYVLGITRSMHLLLQIKSAEIAGFGQKYFRVPHVPHPVRKSTLESFFDENRNYFETNIQYKFRNTEQFSSIFLANHLEIAQDMAILKSDKYVTILNGEMDVFFTVNQKLKNIKSNRVRFLCLQGFECFSLKNRKKIMRVLNEMIT